jgi:hypothetical protein
VAIQDAVASHLWDAYSYFFMDRQRQRLKSEAELNECIIKMVACLQVGLEYMDDFTHSKLYSKGAKFHAKALTKELELRLGMVYNQFRDGEDEDTYLNIERGIREFVAKPISDIYAAGEREDNEGQDFYTQDELNQAYNTETK